MIGRMSSRTIGKLKRKAKKSYTLSPESVAFLEAMRKKRRAVSISAILDEILNGVRRKHELASIERTVAEYYGSLSTEETADQIEWGEFALQEFPNKERA
jgi:hypothetical protein